MKLTRYKLGDLIVQRREKNEGFDVPIRGVSREGFIKPKQQDADTSIYNVFYRNDFVFNPARMELNSIALNLEFDKALCSSLYEVFYVKDQSIVLPEFLNLHIKRDEFARHCEYIGSGSAREYCRVAQISEFDIDLPSIEVQQKIVDANRLLAKRIDTNKKLIATLEQTAQTLYRHTFVDNIDPNNLPEGWRMGTLGDVCEISSSKRIFESEYQTEGIPFYRGKEITQKKNGEPVTDLICISKERYRELSEKYGNPQPGDILLTAVGTLGNSYMVQQEDFYFKDGNIVWFNKFAKDWLNYYLYSWMQTQWFANKINEISIGSTQKAITIAALKEMCIIVPSEKEGKDFVEKYRSIANGIYLKQRENQTLTQMQTLLLSKMGA